MVVGAWSWARGRGRVCRGRVRMAVRGSLEEVGVSVAVWRGAGLRVTRGVARS